MLEYEQHYDSELVFATVGGVGVDHSKIARLISDRLEMYRYKSRFIRLSQDIIPEISEIESDFGDLFDRGMTLMDLGNKARLDYGDNGILALATAAKIKNLRGTQDEVGRNAYIVTSLKRPEEANQLRNIYSGGFYLFGIYSSPERRESSLTERRTGMTRDQARRLIARDENESEHNGQRTRSTFQLADFFLEDDGDEERLRNELNRIIDLIFGYPYITPTFDEYAMFQAFSAALRSADLSRQVGAVIAINDEILSSGANDCPKPMGGLYWPLYSSSKKRMIDVKHGRDFMREKDTNATTLREIIDQITSEFEGETKVKIEEAIKSSDLPSLTEYGRMVHAEMEAILNCARNTISCRGATLYATTFPCHNCAKHIIAAGIKKVIYVEPYPKSRAASFYSDAISTNPRDKKKVLFAPFMGVGPRQFFDLFSMNLSSGRSLIRKGSDARTVSFDHASAEPRVSMRLTNYKDFEQDAATAIQLAATTLKRATEFPEPTTRHEPPTKKRKPKRGT